MLCGLVLGCCKKGGSLRSYFLLHSQISGKRNQEVVGGEGVGYVSNQGCQESGSGRICQEDKEALTWAEEGSGGLCGPQSHSIDGHSDSDQSINPSRLGRRAWKASCRPWVPVANWYGGNGPDGRHPSCHTQMA